MARNDKESKETVNEQAAPAPQAADQAEPTILMQLSKADLIEIIRESRRDPAKEAKDQAEADRQNSRRAQMVKIARADEKARKSRESQCQHKKPNGEETSGGQEF